MQIEFTLEILSRMTPMKFNVSLIFLFFIFDHFSLFSVWASFVNCVFEMKCEFLKCAKCVFKLQLLENKECQWNELVNWQTKILNIQNRTFWKNTKFECSTILNFPSAMSRSFYVCVQIELWCARIISHEIQMIETRLDSHEKLFHKYVPGISFWSRLTEKFTIPSKCFRLIDVTVFISIEFSFPLFTLAQYFVTF